MAIANFYANTFNSYNTALITGSQTAASNLLTAINPTLVGAVMIFVLVIGVMTLTHNLSFSRFLSMTVRAVAIVAILQLGNYTSWVETMFLTTIPNFIASTIGTATSGLTVPQQFDLLRSAINHEVAALLAATDGESIGMIGQNISIRMGNEFIMILLTGCWIIDFLATAMVAIVAPAGTILLIAYIFDKTRHWAERWVGKLVALMILQLFVAILLIIVVQQYRTYWGTIEGTSVGGGINLDEQIDMLWTTGWTFLIGFALLLILPAIATAIGGGHVSGLVVAPIRFGGNQISQLAGAVSRGVSNAMRRGGQ